MVIIKIHLCLLCYKTYPLCHKRKINIIFRDNMQQKQLNTPDDSVEQVTFWQAFLFWLKLGFISFGGQLDKSL